MKFDDVLKHIGEFGPHQIRIYIMVCLVSIPCAFNQMAQVFYTFPSEHWCAVDDWIDTVEDCQATANDTDYLQCIHSYRNASIPITTDDGEVVYEQCKKYNDDYQEWTDDYYAGNETSDVIECDEGWVHDRSEYTRTIITDYDLVCDRKSTPDLAMSIFFVGVLIGSLLFGSLSDIIGRFYSFYISVTMLAATSLITAFMPTMWSYTLLRFLVAIGNIGIYLLAFVIGTELVGPSKRNFAGILICIFYSFGYMLLTGLAYFIRDWRVLQLVIAAPTFLFFLTIPFVTESSRWLISRKRFDEAEKIIKKAAKVNKTTEKLPPDFMQQIRDYEKAGRDDNGHTPTFVDLFKTPNLRWTTINLMYNWCINSLVYYGISLSTSGLGTNVYVSFFISGAVEVPAYLLCLPLMESPLGRRYSTSFFELLGGVACLITIFVPLGVWKTTIAMIGKFGISASFALVYIYSAEVCPTPLRSIGVGMCSTAARIGGILAPLILLLDQVWEPLPLIIFGGSAITGALFILLLPETRGKKLPETIREGEIFNMRNGKTEVNDEEDGKVVTTINGSDNLGYDEEKKM